MTLTELRDYYQRRLEIPGWDSWHEEAAACIDAAIARIAKLEAEVAAWKASAEATDKAFQALLTSRLAHRPPDGPLAPNHGRRAVQYLCHHCQRIAIWDPESISVVCEHRDCPSRRDEG